MIHTRLTELLECEHPVMLAGMGGVSYSALVAAVSDAGGFGTLGAAPMGLDRMKAEMLAKKEKEGRPVFAPVVQNPVNERAAEKA